MKWLLSISAVACTVIVVAGCVKGPLWRTGYASPWARQRWAEEEQIAPTLFSKRQELAAMVDSASKGTAADRERVAGQLAQIVQSDATLLVRVEAVRLLGKVDADAARAALRMASQDAQSELRMAVVHACAEKDDPDSIQVLQQIIGGDSDVDIRLAATRALNGHRGPQAVQALALALDDPNPALQLRAAESLRTVTGENFGNDIRAWREYVRRNAPADIADEPAQIAEQPESLDSITR